MEKTMDEEGIYSGDDFDENKENASLNIHNAVLSGDCAKILSLLEEGCDIDADNGNNETPLLSAINHEQYNVVKLLLSHDALVIKEGFDDALLLATAKADEEAVQILLDNDCNPSYSDSWNEWTPLHEACHKGLISILQKFVRICDLDARNEEGATPVYITCQYGQKECLQLLLNHNADASIAVDSADTPLHIACQEGHSDCVAVLLNHGVEIDSESHAGRTPLAAACINDNYDCAQLLLENHASLESDDSPIHLAARHTSCLCLSLLIENGASVNSISNGRTPLYEAVSHGNLQGCKMLLSKGADPNCICENELLTSLYQTPLMVAASEKELDCVEIIKELVSYNADVNQTTFTSPLILAARFANYRAFNQLLNYDVDINYVDKQGNSALSLLCVTTIYSDDRSASELFECCRNLLIKGASITLLIPEDENSFRWDGTYLRCFPELMPLLLEFSTCRQELHFLSEIADRILDEQQWELLYNFICRPRKLKHLCRIKIRCVLGVERLKKIEVLPIPTPMKKYLQHSEKMTF